MCNSPRGEEADMHGPRMNPHQGMDREGAEQDEAGQVCLMGLDRGKVNTVIKSSTWKW